MSWSLVRDVWERSRWTPNETLVLLALADYADDDGTSIFPRVTTLARRTRLSHRTVQRCLRTLQDESIVIVDREARGHRGRVYRINRLMLAAAPRHEKPASCGQPRGQLNDDDRQG